MSMRSAATAVPEHLRVPHLDISSSNAIEWVKPNRVTSYDLDCMTEVQPGELEISEEKLNSILDEVREIFIRSGVTSMLRSGDLIVGIYTANGDLAAASCGTYLHAITASIPIKWVIDRYLQDPTVGIREGDAFYCNEARFGGIHNPDQMAFMPIFHDSELIAWSCALVHQPETGAVEPGGMPILARSRYDEGMKLTPIKVCENYEMKRDLLDMMVNFIGRAPRMQEIDARARVNAANRLRIRVQEIAAARGACFVHGLLRKLVVEAETAARKRISRWPDGTYRANIFADTIGREPGLIRGSLAATVRGDSIEFDFSGTSPENDSSYNAFPHIVAAHAAIYVFAYPFSDLPVSNGTFAPFDWKVPEGTCFNASEDAAISNSPTLLSIVMSLMPLVFSKMMFSTTDRLQVGAPNGNMGSEIVWGGPNQYGVPVADLDAVTLNNEGQGARSDMDGAPAYGFPWCHAGRSPDAEDFESEYQFLRLYHRLREDSGGFGMWQGGAGIETALVVRHVPSVSFMSIGKSAYCSVAVGLFGGYPSASNPGVWVRQSGLWDRLQHGEQAPHSTADLLAAWNELGQVLLEHPNRPTRTAQNGDIIVQMAAGGGGYGDVLERDPNSVLGDVKAGLITAWTAENVYQVRFDHETLALDLAATEAARQAERQARLTRGKPWDEFTSEWNELRPAPEALRFFGRWPDGMPEKPIERI
jgi:N-methylhydantoinase B/oxoprolinase/acetone carboxylase alpha subunit